MAMDNKTIVHGLRGISGRSERLGRIYGGFPSVDPLGARATLPNLGKGYIYRERERAMELKLTGIALNHPKNQIRGKKYTTEVKWVLFI